MSVDVSPGTDRPARTRPGGEPGPAEQPEFDTAQARQDAAARWAGTPLAVEHWLEGESGFPAGSVGDVSGADAMGSATEAVRTARGVTLTRRQLTEVLAFVEFMAGCALPAAERAELEEDIVDAFEDAPKAALKSLRQLSGGVRRIGSLDPIERSQRRLQALTTSYTIDRRRQSDGAEPNPVLGMVGRHNPVLRHWESTGIILVADALAARVAQHRLVLSLVGYEPEEPAALSERLLERTAHAGRLEIAELAASELRLLGTRAWLRDLGRAAFDRLRADLAHAVPSALDVDVVVQQVAFRAFLGQPR